MSNLMKRGSWSVKVNVDDINIDSFVYRPGDAKRITSLLGFAGSMSGMEVLPDGIEDPPFAIHFSEDGSLTLDRSEGAKGEIKFKFEEIDDLIILVDDLVKVAIDEHTLRPRPRGAVPTMALPGDADIITGRS